MIHHSPHAPSGLDTRFHGFGRRRLARDGASRLALLLATIVWAFPLLASAQQVTSRVVIDDFQVARWVTDNRDALNIPSIAVGIVGPTEDHFLEIFGEGELHQPFLIGSLTKSVTAMGIALLVHEGKVSLDDEAREWVEGVPPQITIGHLLHQTSGLDRADGVDGWTRMDATADELVAEASWSEPGEFSYSNLNYQILGAVIERVTEQPYAKFVRERLFEPLKLVNATATRPPNAVVGHQYMFGFPVANGEPEYSSVTVPSGFVWMSANDLARWVRVFVTRGKLDGEQVIPAEVIELLLTEPDATPYAGGWIFTSRYEPVAVAQHTGATGAFTSAMAVVPEREFGVFVLTNVNSWMATAPANVMKGLLATIIGTEKETATNLELIGRVVFGGFVALIVFTFFFELVRWLRAGLPRRLVRKEAVAVALTFLINIAVVIAVPIFFGASLTVMYATQPDITLGFLATVVFGALRRLLTGFNKTAGLHALEPDGS